MPNDRISPLEVVLGNILGEESPSRPDKKQFLSELILITTSIFALCKHYSKGVSRNQLLNDLLAVAIDQVSSALPDGVSDAYEESVAHHEQGLNELLAIEGHL